MQVELNKAIVHVLDTAVDAPVLSQCFLPLTDEAAQYLGGHAAKCFASEEARACVLTEDAPVSPLLWNIEDTFVEKSGTLATDWFAILHENPSIPAGDVAFLLLNMDGAEYFAALKLNYKSGYVHYFANENGASCNEIVRQNAVLPGSGGKADEAFFINLQTKEVRLIEKKYEIDGHKSAYLATRLLGCKTGLSPKEKLSVIKAAAGEVNQKFYGNTGVDEQDLAAAVCAEYYTRDEKESVAPVQAICDKLYSDMPHAREAFTQALAAHDIALSEPLPVSGAAVRRLEKQSIRSGDGVEIKVPVSLYKDAAALEFIRNADGTMSLLIKNILM
ncbi:MAG: nucleoid-associated protein [Ruthenibacterium sp.]